MSSCESNDNNNDNASGARYVTAVLSASCLVCELDNMSLFCNRVPPPAPLLLNCIYDTSGLEVTVWSFSLLCAQTKKTEPEIGLDYDDPCN